jgi:hypothetical protein
LSPLSVIAVPLALIIIGIVLNSIHIVHDQPAYSLENDPANKLAAERQSNYHFFFLQRARMLKRQKRIGQYSWLVLGVVIASSWLLYSDTVKATTVSKQISAIQTLPVAGSREAVLSLTLSDGSRTQYLVKATEPRSAISVMTDERVKEAIQNAQLTSLGTAVNDSAATVPLGIALRITN